MSSFISVFNCPSQNASEIFVELYSLCKNKDAFMENKNRIFNVSNVKSALLCWLESQNMTI